jgi:maleylpyruvate isomerase
MYATPKGQAAGIERGPRMSASELDFWLHHSAAELAIVTDRLTDE